MAKALFLSLPLHGHTNPSLPLVRELVGRGDEVLYYSTDTFAEKIAQTGARYRPYRNEFLADLRQLPERLEKLSWLFMRTTEDLLGGELAAFRAERPGSVSESLYYGVPLLVVPKMSEQEVVGRRVEELGAGLYLAKAKVTAATLRESVEQVLAEERFAEQAAIVRASFLAAGGVTRAADAIMAFTRTV